MIIITKLLNTSFQNYYQFLYKKYRRVYNDIEELPIYNWIKIKDSGSLKYLYVTGDYSGNFFIFNKVVDAYDVLMSQYIEAFILNTETQERLVIERDVLVAKLEAMISGSHAERILAKHLEDSLSEPQSEQDFYDVVAMLETHLGFSIDLKNTSVKKFYSHIKKVVENGKKANTDRRFNSEGNI